MLTSRQDVLLKALIGEYIAQATPVASEVLAHKYNLGVSPATIRNEMARLEEEDYILRPHTSAGGMPSTKAYRYYVESLLETPELPPQEQLFIQHLFHQIETEMEEWVRLAANLLARLAHNAALATLPRAAPCRFQYVELVALQEFLILLTLMLREARLKQQLVTTEEAISQEQLNAVASKLNATYRGRASSQIAAQSPESQPLEQTVSQAVMRLMEQEDQRAYESPLIQGLRQMLEQPEFATHQRILEVLELLSEPDWLKDILPQGSNVQGIHVIIGGEGRSRAMRHCSIVLAQYGMPHGASGTLGVLGPTRMPYAHTISTVRYLSEVMNRLLGELYGVA